MVAFILPFAGSGARRPPDSAELATGFKCGELDRELFNWLHWYTTIQTPWWPVVSMTITNPPVDAVPGAMYMIPSGASGDWFDRGQQIAMWTGVADREWAIIPTPDGHGIGLPDGKIFTKIDGVYVEKKSDAFPSGTRLLFQQSAAPIGWTKEVSHNNKALRLVNGSVTTGGYVNFTSAFSSETATSTVSVSGTIGGTSLTVNQIPSHSHTFNGTTSGHSNDHAHSWGGTFTTDVQGDHRHGPIGQHHINAWPGGKGTMTTGGNATATGDLDLAGNHAHNVTVGGTTGGSGADHSHSYSGSTSAIGADQSHSHSFSSASHNHTIDLAVQYVDVIICSKD